VAPSGRCAGLAQNAVELILEQQFFFFEQLDLLMDASLNARLHVFDLLVQVVVLLKQATEMVVGGFEFANEFTVFWKHTGSYGWAVGSIYTLEISSKNTAWML
jgi:hypothetical protein